MTTQPDIRNRRPRTGPPPEPEDPVTARQKGDRKACARLRRYAAANARLGVSAVLTFADEPPDRAAAVHQGSLFIERFARRRRGRGREPWVYVPGIGSRTQRWHLHVLLPFTLRRTVADAWGRGHVIGFRFVHGNDARRRIAAYLCHHFADRREEGQRRFYCAPGFRPEHRVIEVGTTREGVDLAIDLMGREPDDLHRTWVPGPGQAQIMEWHDRWGDASDDGGG